MMGNIKDEYAKFEDTWITEIGKPGQVHRISRALLNLIRERSLGENIKPEDYEQRLSEMQEFLYSLKYALTNDEDEANQTIWSHRPVRDVTGADNASKTFINQNSLLDLVAQYLARPWMQQTRS